MWYSPQQYNSQSVKQLRMYVKNNHFNKKGFAAITPSTTKKRPLGG